MAVYSTETALKNSESGMRILSSCDICGSSELVFVDKAYNICKCKECGFVFRNPRPIPEDIYKFYSRINKYCSWLEHKKGRDLLWMKRLAMIRRHKQGGELLDVGAGIGEFVSLAGRYFNAQGSEVSDSAIQTAKERYGIILLRGNIEELDLKGKRFDVITLFHVLEHVPSPDAVIGACQRLLAKDGVIFIALPNELMSILELAKRPVKRLLSFIPGYKGKKFGIYGLPGIDLENDDEIHLSYFTSATISRLLRRHNIKVISDGLDPYYSCEYPKRLFYDLVYVIFRSVHFVSRINVYETMWIMAGR